MSALETLVLGIIQGFTEFLPISSSGHLELVKAIFGSDYQQNQSILITLTLHSATALSTVFVFRKDIWVIFSDLFYFKRGESLDFSLKILISMAPAVLIGLFFEDIISSLFDGKITLVGAMLIITSVLLYLADRINKNNSLLSFKNAFLIGLIQAVAIIPGISRSGSTIALAVLLTIKRDKAARFSFLMVIPLIFGSMAKSLLEGNLLAESPNIMPLAIGFFSAFITGVFACKWMIKLVKKSQLKYFSFYCMIVGLVAIIYSSL